MSKGLGPKMERVPGNRPSSSSRGVYLTVKARLTDGLRSGEWRPGDALPNEAWLSVRYQVSIGTLRKAVGELVDEGILVRRQGSGTFVATHDAARQFHFFRIVPREGKKEFPAYEVLSFSRCMADAPTRLSLGLAARDRVIRIGNLLRLSGQPTVVDTMTLPVRLFANLTAAGFRDRKDTIYGLYQSNFNVTVVRTVERLRAENADPGTATALGIKVGAAILVIDRTAFTFGDRPVELRTRRVNTTNFEYLSDIDKDEGTTILPAEAAVLAKEA